MSVDPQHARDQAIQRYYADLFNEDARLTTRSAQGVVEFARTQELLLAALPPRATVLDIGGATGHHARALRSRGCTVELIDPIAEHVATARASGIAAQIGDARSLPYDDDSFDAAVLLGPLYHLDSPGREQALHEALRVTRPGGLIAAAGLSRLVSYAAAAETAAPTVPYPPELVNLLASGMPLPSLRFPAAHFHTAQELANELGYAGVEDVQVHGVEGPAGLMLERASAGNQELIDAALVLARAGSDIDGVADQSVHILAIGRVPAAGATSDATDESPATRA